MGLHIWKNDFHFHLGWGWPTFSVKVPASKYFRLMGHMVSVTTTVLNSATDKGMLLCSIKFYLWTLKFKLYIILMLSFKTAFSLSSFTLIERLFSSSSLSAICISEVIDISHFSHVQLFVTLWTIAHQAPLFMNSPSKNTGVDCHALLQGIFPLANIWCKKK